MVNLDPKRGPSGLGPQPQAVGQLNELTLALLAPVAMDTI